MRPAQKSQLIYLLFAVSCYSLGSWITPETINTNLHWVIVCGLGVVYFAVMPAVHFWLVVHKAKQAKWKTLIVLSLSCLVVRYTAPENIASYFEFISYVRYPIIGILLVIEFALIFTVVKGLWSARKLGGDPRVHVINTPQLNDKKQDLAMLTAHEPAAWYYAIPRFSRNHVPALGHLELRSGQLNYFALYAVLLVLATIGTYSALVIWSELVAIIVASLIGYSLITLVANYRLCRYFSIYVRNDKLVVNNTFFAMAVIPLDKIKKVTLGNFDLSDDKNKIVLGRGRKANVQILLQADVNYYFNMGSSKEAVNHFYLNTTSSSFSLPMLPLANAS